MSVKVLHPGLLTTIQDIGRFGSQKYGVIASGAMDTYSLRIGNLLVGNKEQEAGLEITLFGTTLQFAKDAFIAITGGDLQATIDGVKAPLWCPIYIKKESILKFQSAIKGSRAYVTFAGGIQVTEVMGSKSTYLRAKIGGFEGRALQKGDVFSIADLSPNIRESINRTEDEFSKWSVNYNELIHFNKHQEIRVIRGTEFERFKPESQTTFFREPFTLTVQSDRMGYRLEGPPISIMDNFELLSEGVTFGTVQIPSSGQPIILMADRQTTGGYPKIAQVISADLPTLAQLQPTSMIQFTEVTLEEAEQILIQKEQLINLIKRAINYKVSP